MLAALTLPPPTHPPTCTCTAASSTLGSPSTPARHLASSRLPDAGNQSVTGVTRWQSVSNQVSFSLIPNQPPACLELRPDVQRPCVIPGNPCLKHRWLDPRYSHLLVKDPLPCPLTAHHHHHQVYSIIPSMYPPIPYPL
jgi:hypothetical protein